MHVYKLDEWHMFWQKKNLILHCVEVLLSWIIYISGLGQASLPRSSHKWERDKFYLWTFRWFFSGYSSFHPPLMNNQMIDDTFLIIVSNKILLILENSGGFSPDTPVFAHLWWTISSAGMIDGTFLIIVPNIDCGYPWSMFFVEIWKIIYNQANPTFSYIKCSFSGCSLHWFVSIIMRWLMWWNILDII